MIRKLFILAIILIAINYFYGDDVEAWWNGWRSGERFKEIGQQLVDQTIEEVKQSSFQYSKATIRELSQKLPKDIQLQIDNWLLSQNLNEYGDPEDTMYAGGTPTFDEQTGETINRFELIFDKFPGLIDSFKDSIVEFKEAVEQIGEQAIEEGN